MLRLLDSNLGATTNWTNIDSQASFSENCTNNYSFSKLGVNEYTAAKTFIKMFNINEY